MDAAPVPVGISVYYIAVPDCGMFACIVYEANFEHETLRYAPSSLNSASLEAEDATKSLPLNARSDWPSDA